MNVDDIIIIVIIVILILYVHKECICTKGDNHTTSTKSSSDRFVSPIENMRSVSNVIEGMAPLDFGTYYNNYPRGQCSTGRFWDRTDCEVGNCNLGTTVSDQQFCRIQCAQDPDAEERQDCYDVCMKNIC